MKFSLPIVLLCLASLPWHAHAVCDLFCPKSTTTRMSTQTQSFTSTLLQTITSTAPGSISTQTETVTQTTTLAAAVPQPYAVLEYYTQNTECKPNIVGDPSGQLILRNKVCKNQSVDTIQSERLSRVIYQFANQNCKLSVFPDSNCGGTAGEANLTPSKGTDCKDGKLQSWAPADPAREGRVRSYRLDCSDSSG
jgi:hypothetical protein